MPFGFHIRSVCERDLLRTFAGHLFGCTPATKTILHSEKLGSRPSLVNGEGRTPATGVVL